MTREHFSYVNAILNELRYNVALLRMEGEDLWIIYSEFNSSGGIGSSAVEYCTITGIEITDFFIQTHINPLNEKVRFIQTLQSYLKTATEVAMKYNRNMPYILFTK